MRRAATLAIAAATLIASGALAAPPPADAKPLSQILAAIEAQGNVRYFDEVEWDDSGYWKIEYVDRAGAKVVTAKVPLKEMFGYATDVRSMTQGRANYTMHFDHYAPVPQAIAEEVRKKMA